jgi:alkylhydroperoxidase family enzyme
LARRLGATEEQLSGIARADYAAFDDAWRPAFLYADAMTPTPGIVSQDVYDALAAQWSAEQVVEITAVIAMFNFFNRFAHALNIPVTK